MNFGRCAGLGGERGFGEGTEGSQWLQGGMESIGGHNLGEKIRAWLAERDLLLWSTWEATQSSSGLGTRDEDKMNVLRCTGL